MSGSTRRWGEWANRRLFKKLAVAALLMFGFGFLLVPFYDAICRVTGINNLGKPDEVAENTQVDRSRQLTIEYDSNVRSKLPWTFKPEAVSAKVHPGELVHINYLVTNRSGRPVTAQAIPSYGPSDSMQYFKKLDCFCFKQQTFKPGETRTMTVVYVIDPKVPLDMNTITLSYTFFEVEGNG